MKLLTPVLIVFALTSLAQLISKQTVEPSVILGTFVYGAMLFGINEFSPELASALAWVVVITVFLTHGTTVLGAITKGAN